jgi:hypothetical protein
MKREPVLNNPAPLRITSFPHKQRTTTPGGKQMFEQAEYQHPQLKPYSSGSWQEVFFSWIFGATALAGVLLSM